MLVKPQLGVLLLASLCSAPAQQVAEPKHKTPFSYEVELGGVTPVGQTRSSGGYSSSFMFGGGFGLPVKSWLSLDLANVGFGFDTTNQNQTVVVSNGTTSTTYNYQVMFESGARINVPLGHRLRLGLGGGFAAAAQNEYIPNQYTQVGPVTVVTQVDCTTCSQVGFRGAYAGARLFGMSSKYSTIGVDAKYMMLHGGNAAIYQNVPPQNWLAVGALFLFGI